MRRERLIALVLAIVTLLLFGRVVFHEFLNYDDFDYVTGNRVVRQGLTPAGIGWAFTARHAGNWHPVTWLSHMLDCQVFGLRPGGHHAVSLLLHAANTVLVFASLRRLTGAPWRSAIVAALFAWHPLRVESVAWIAERKDVLSTFFWLLALDAYARRVPSSILGGPEHRAGATPVRYGLALLWFALGLMSKPMVVTLPFTLLLLDFWPLRRFEAFSQPGWTRAWFLIREKWAFFALAVISSAITLSAQQQSGTLASLASLPLSSRIGNALNGYLAYMEKVLWPRNLAVIYPLDPDRPAWTFALSGAVVIGLTAAAVAVAKRRPYAAMGWFWFLITLVPVIGLVQVGVQAIADRYTYVPVLGLFIVLAWTAGDLAGETRWRRRVTGLAVTGALVSCVVLSATQLAYWRDSVALLTHTVAVTRDNHVAEINLGHALLARGAIAEAQRHFEAALRIRPDYAEARQNLALCLAEQGRLDDAIAQCDLAMQTNPRYVEVHHLKGLFLSQLGRRDEAMTWFYKTLQLAPLFGPVHLSLATALVEQGRASEAVTHFQAAITQQDTADLRYRFGNVLLRLGRHDGAILQYQRAVELEPAFVEARNNLASALTARGDLDAALSQLRESMRLRPDYLEARFNLAVLLARTGRSTEAAVVAQTGAARAASAGNTNLAAQFQQLLNSLPPQTRSP